MARITNRQLINSLKVVLFLLLKPHANIEIQIGAWTFERFK